jgi:uncharacterized protein YjbI with pentapeptide repeats
VLTRLREEDSFDGLTFTGLELQAAALGGKEFYRCVFENCHLQESSWKNSKLEACVFRGCDLTRASLHQAGLRGVRFEGSKLMGIDWSHVSPHPELAFIDCNLRYASFVRINLRKASFERCAAREANFLDADLTDCDFTGTDLAGSNFQGCTLTGTDFRGASGCYFDPARNRVKKTRVPVETAVLLAQSLGLTVDGHGEEPKRRGSR